MKKESKTICVCLHIDKHDVNENVKMINPYIYK